MPGDTAMYSMIRWVGSRVTCQLSSRVTCQVVEPARAVSAAGPAQGGVRAGRRQGAVRPPALAHGQVRRSDK